jgi:hypothetical protein
MTKRRLRARQFSSWSTEGRVHLVVESNPGGPPRLRLQRSIFDLPLFLTSSDLHALAAQLEVHLVEGDRERAALQAMIDEDFAREDDDLDLGEPTPVAFTVPYSVAAVVPRPAAAGPGVVVERSEGSAQSLWVRVFTEDDDVCFFLDAESTRELVHDLRIAADATEALERNPTLAFSLNLSHPTPTNALEGASLQ